MELTITTTVQEAGSEPVEVTKIIPVPPVPTIVESTTVTTVELAGSDPIEVTKIAARIEKQ